MAKTFTIDELTTPLTRAEVQQSIYDVLGILGVSTTSWKSGAVVRSMIVATSVVVSALSQLQANIARSGFLQYAVKDWLTLVARYVYGVERIEATFASGEVTLSNSGGGVFAFDPDDLIFSNPATGATYRNTAAVNIAALEPGVVVPVRATVAGSASNANPGDITVMTTVVLGVTCTNVNSLTGADQESDSELRTRCSERLGALSPFGPWDAYAYAVRSATRPDGTNIGVTRMRITKDGYGNVTTYLAGREGEIPGDPEDITTDLGIANDAVQRNAAPLAVNAIVLSADALPIQVNYEVWIYNTSGRTRLEITDGIEAALAAFMRAQPIGGNIIDTDPGKIFVNAIRTAIFTAFPEVFQVEVSEPVADVVLLSSEVPTLGAVIVVDVHQEPPPEGFGGAV